MTPLSPAGDDSTAPGPRSDRGVRAAWLILVITFSATLLAWALDRQAVRHGAEVRFSIRSDDLADTIASRMETYEQVLRSGVGLFRASDKVSFLEWRAYVASVDVEGHYPGILGIGYVAYVRRAQLPGFLEELAAQPMPPFPLHPTGTRDLYAPVTYIEPFDQRNRRAFGFDMYTEPVRRAAIDQARDTGQPVLSAPVILAQESGPDVQPGVLMYVPFYRGNPATPEERRYQLVGLVYAPFRMRDLVESTVGHPLTDVRLVIDDGPHEDPERRIYDSLPGSNAPARCEHTAQRTITVATRPWTLRVCSLVPFTAPADLATEHIILGMGSIISLLLFGITWSLATTRARAVTMAQRMTHELSEERTRLSEIAAALGEGLYVQDTTGTITYCNPAAAHLLGWETDALIGHSSLDLLAPQAQQTAIGTHRHAVARESDGGNRYAPEETLFQCRDGSTVAVSVISTVLLRGGNPVGSVVAFHDVTEQRHAQAALREAQQFTALFQYSRDAYFLMDLTGCIIDANRVAVESLGYSREELLGSSASRFVRWSTVPQPGQSLPDFFETLGTTATRGEAEYIRKDGTSFFVEAAFSPLLHEHKKMILISARDITERKEAERRIQRALDDLERSRREIEETNRRLAESNRQLQRLTRRDSLTGIANRRSFDEYLDLEWNRAARDRRPLSLLMIDVDHFKAYNDHFGHPAGDDCLRRVASTLDGQLSRSIDVVARYGGEEFVVVLPETPITGAVNIGERLRHAIEELALPHPASSIADRVTISVGAATTIPRPGDPKEILVSAADGALYRAKQGGRNRVCTPATPQG